MKCRKCGKRISEEEAEENDGMCEKCFNKVLGKKRLNNRIARD